MDYMKLLHDLKNEFFAANKERYKNMNKVLAFILTIFFIPMRVVFFFARIGYWFTWFFFRAISAPIDYLQGWMKGQKDEVKHATQAVIYLVCLPYIFFQQVMLSLNALSFYFQWFGLMLSAYIMTLGKVRWQPVISDAQF